MGRKRKPVDWGQLPDILTVTEAAPLVRMEPAAYRYHARLGRVPGRQLGRRWWIPKVEIMRYLGIAEGGETA